VLVAGTTGEGVLLTPDDRLAIYTVSGGGLTLAAEVPVGLEPVAVAARSNTEVWVVNHLSDSVSVVALDDTGRSGQVVRTVLVGDEPRDIVFAGPKASRSSPRRTAASHAPTLDRRRVRRGDSC
jgi:YVTN family beta-propeller protein